jgi:hypothetical protein
MRRIRGRPMISLAAPRGARFSEGAKREARRVQIRPALYAAIVGAYFGLYVGRPEFDSLFHIAACVLTILGSAFFFGLVAFGIALAGQQDREKPRTRSTRRGMPRRY